MLNAVAAIGLAALPAIAILLYVRKLDRARPEPVGLIGRSVLYGFIAVIPTAAIELSLGTFVPSPDGLAGRFYESFIVAGLIEEGAKLFFLRRYIFRRREFDERADGIVYAVCVSLGFAFAENVMYGFEDPFVLVARAVTAVPGHAIFSGIMGYYVGIAKIEGRGKGAGTLAKGLFWAVFLHGLYDFLVLSGPAVAFVAALLPAGGVALARLFRSSLERDAADAASVDRRRGSGHMDGR
ncbi:MAG: PrsW family glutamic-type intramembrane protease [Spirochaetaceae bacterium]|nr:PrsW family glutamic-type intramembrane protease [Spirochaetaceae bacterium]